ncbi:class I SAM-dependent methyltransferase [Cryobacterium sp. BB307]|uniref:class I SAM-dependent methyltransferase n=1 Tax=Cryobacterium sp. BB307 TaxID=2716317 RepID=UPI0014456601|nr:class I SAM-dependent methyltransferase [Cryobacterium sp. BB307]
MIEVVGSRLTARIYDPFLWLGERLGMQSRRRRLLSTANGRVLEIGAGTGLNLSHYPAIDELVLAEPSEPMAQRLETRRSKLGRSAQIVAAPAEELPFEDGSFDTVVSTLVLCTVLDSERALAEVRRVLRPGGRLLFCEHVRSDSPRLARWQDRFADTWAGIADGCRCNRETLATISSQLEIVTIERANWRGMPHLGHPLVIGEAVHPAPTTSGGRSAS